MNKKALTLVEVMIAMVVIVVIVMGSMSYLYATLMNARHAEAKATASRLASMFINSLKVGYNTYPFVLDEFDMAHPTRSCIGREPLHNYAELSGIPELNGLPATGSPTAFRYYMLFVDDKWYWIKLTYEETWPGTSPDIANPLRQFDVIVAWNHVLSNENTLNYNRLRCIILSSYVRTFSQN